MYCSTRALNCNKDLFYYILVKGFISSLVRSFIGLKVLQPERPNIIIIRFILNSRISMTNPNTLRLVSFAPVNPRTGKPSDQVTTYCFN